MRLAHSRVTAFGSAVCLIGLAACGLVFSPGEYADGLLPDGPPASAKHLLVLAGERDSPDTATSDMWLAPTVSSVPT